MKIGIIGAMEVEIEVLKNKLEELVEVEIHGFTFYEGRVKNHQVIVLLSGVGKVSAAVGTTLLIEKYTPDFIINTGTAGGLGTSQVHDLILATEVRHHDVDLTGFGYEPGQQSKMPAAFVTDKKWTALAERLVAKHSQQLHKGLVVSGDAFINDPQRLKEIQATFPAALAVEMEAASIAQVCYMLEVPFVVLRAVSDVAGEGNTLSFESFVKSAGKLSAEINLDFIQNL